MKLSALRAQLPVIFFKEKRTYIAYSPALDLSASGATIQSAKKNFEGTLKIFFQDLVDEGTLESVLKDLGWMRENREWQPPIEVKQMISIPFSVPVPR